MEFSVLKHLFSELSVCLSYRAGLQSKPQR